MSTALAPSRATTPGPPLPESLKPGQAVLWHVDNDTYHATHEAAGSSMLKCFRRSPARFCGLYVDHTIGPATRRSAS